MKTLEIIERFIEIRLGKKPEKDLIAEVFQCLFLCQHVGTLIDLIGDSEEQKESGFIFCDSLGDINKEQELKICCHLMAKSYNALNNNESPFYQYTSYEWLYGNLLKDAIDSWLDTHSDCENCPIHSNYSQISSDYKYPFGGFWDEDFWNEFNVGDSSGVCSILYPSAWNEEINCYLSYPLARAIKEFESIWDKTSNDFYGSLKFKQKQPNNQADENKDNHDSESNNKQVSVKKPKISYLYLMKCNRNGLYKIGVSVDPKYREKTLTSDDPSIQLVGSWDKLSCYERDWHIYFANHRVRGEWFNLTPAQVRLFCSICQKRASPPIHAIQ